MINISIFIFVLISPYAFLFSEMSEGEWEKKREEERIAYTEYSTYIKEIRGVFAKQVDKEFNLYGYGGKGMMHAKIEHFGMDFVAHRRATIEEARALHLAIMEKFVEAVNRHEKIQPFLEVQPFSYQRAAISISFVRKDHDAFADDSIAKVFNISGNATAEQNRNKLFYCSSDPYRESYVDRFSETYEEAVKLAAASHIKGLAVHEGNEKEELMDQLLDGFVQEMKELGVYYRDIGGKFFIGPVKEIGGSFNVFHKANQEEARQLVLHMTEKLLETVNKNEKLKPYLEIDPFPSSSIKIKIGFRDKRHEPYYDGSVTDVRLDNGKIAYEKYAYRDKSDKWSGYSFVFGEENYEDVKETREDPPQSIKKFYSIYHSLLSQLNSLFHTILSLISHLF